MAASGLLTLGTSCAALGDAVAAEALRRAASIRIGAVSETERLWLAWALVGQDPRIPHDSRGQQTESVSFRFRGDSFDPFTAGDHLEMLEQEGLTVTRRSSGVAAQHFIFKGNAQLMDWVRLRAVLRAWSPLALTNEARALWDQLDDSMEADSSDLDMVETALTALKTQSLIAVEELVDSDDAVSAVLSACGFASANSRPAIAEALRSLVVKRTEAAHLYPVLSAEYPSVLQRNFEDLWGAAATPLDGALYAECERWANAKYHTMVAPVKAGYTNKEYRKRGGVFEFPTRLDTFIDGLHCVTRDLHRTWSRNGRRTGGARMRSAAVGELSLRLRWDDRDAAARVKLSKIVSRIWDSLEGCPVDEAPPLPSALWIDDSDSVDETVHESNQDSRDAVQLRTGTDGRSYTEEEFKACGHDIGQWEVALPAWQGTGVDGVDEGLQMCLERLPRELWWSMEGFVAARKVGELKLPTSLSRLERKAVHMWAEARHLWHKSHGLGSHRYLILKIQDDSGESPSAPPASVVDSNDDDDEWAKLG